MKGELGAITTTEFGKTSYASKSTDCMDEDTEKEIFFYELTNSNERNKNCEASLKISESKEENVFK